MVESERSVGYALLGLGVVLILIGVVLAILRYLELTASGATLSADVSLSMSSLVGVLSQVLFLAVVIWAGSILMSRGANFIKEG
jgi:hypothetical protein